MMSTSKPTSPDPAAAAARTSGMGGLVVETEAERIPDRADHPLEVDDFVAPAGPARRDRSLDRPRTRPGSPARAALRTLARILPLGYGSLVGSLAANSLFGLAVGILISVMIDLSLERYSILRGIYRGLITKACPFAAAAAHVLVRAVAGMGMAVPPTWRQIKCGGTH